MKLGLVVQLCYQIRIPTDDVVFMLAGLKNAKRNVVQIVYFHTGLNGADFVLLM